MRGRGLADRTDIIALAFDGEQHGAPDGARLHALPAPFKPARGKGKFLKDEAHGLEIELGGEVEHREIFVIERLCHLRLLVLAPGDVVVELAMRFHVALDVHAHESDKLHETGIDAPEGAGIAHRHTGDEISLKPVD